MITVVVRIYTPSSSYTTANKLCNIWEKFTPSFSVVWKGSRSNFTLSTACYCFPLPCYFGSCLGCLNGSL